MISHPYSKFRDYIDFYYETIIYKKNNSAIHSLKLCIHLLENGDTLKNIDQN